MGLEVADEVEHLVGGGITHGVGDVQGGGAGGHGGGVALGQEGPLGPGGVLGGELDVVAVALGVADHLADGVHHLLPGHLQLILHVDVAGSEKDMDAGVLGALDRVPGGVDVALGAAGQARHGAVADGLGDGLHATEILGRGDGEARLDHVHTQGVQLTGHVQLLSQVHAAAGGLLAVAEGGVEDLDPFHVGIASFDLMAVRENKKRFRLLCKRRKRKLPRYHSC